MLLRPTNAPLLLWIDPIGQGICFTLIQRLRKRRMKDLLGSRQDVKDEGKGEKEKQMEKKASTGCWVIGGRGR